MPGDKDAQEPASAGAGSQIRSSAAAQARELVREAWKASLSTIARSGGHPYASLVAVAAKPGGSPLLLLSGLAEHTKNIEADGRASLLFDGTGLGRGALTGARLTVVGRIVEEGSDTARRRYLARHPDAAAFIGFADFRLYALEIEWAHLVAGFGRIVRLDATDMVVAAAQAEALVGSEMAIVDHMNEDHASSIEQLALREISRRAGVEAVPRAIATAGPWTMLGCDTDGVDLACGERALRLAFPERATTPDAVRKALVSMVQAARANPLPK